MRSEHKYTLVDPPKKGGLLVFCGVLSGLHHPADDLVARHAGERSHPPFVPREVDVGMADAAKIDLNVNVPVSGSAPFETQTGRGAFRPTGQHILWSSWAPPGCQCISVPGRVGNWSRKRPGQPGPWFYQCQCQQLRSCSRWQTIVVLMPAEALGAQQSQSQVIRVRVSEPLPEKVCRSALARKMAQIDPPKPWPVFYTGEGLSVSPIAK